MIFSLCWLCDGLATGLGCTPTTLTWKEGRKENTSCSSCSLSWRQMFFTVLKIKYKLCCNRPKSLTVMCYRIQTLPHTHSCQARKGRISFPLLTFGLFLSLRWTHNSSGWQRRDGVKQLESNSCVFISHAPIVACFASRTYKQAYFNKLYIQVRK